MIQKRRGLEEEMLLKNITRMKMFIRKCRNDNISAYAAQSAFFIILSIIPFLMLFISLVQYTPVTKGMVMEVVNRTMPVYLTSFLISIIEEIYTRNAGLVSVAAVAAIWASAKGIQYMSGGLNAVYDIKETRNYFRLRLRAMLYTLVLVAAIVLALMLLVFGNSIQGILVEYVPLAAELTGVVLKLRSLIMLGVFIFFFAVLFKMLPNRKATLRSQLPGSVLCAVAWSVFSYGLSVYVDYFNGFSMYGSLTTIVLLMLWMYFCMYIVLVCGEINNIYEDYWERKKNENMR